MMMKDNNQTSMFFLEQIVKYKFEREKQMASATDRGIESSNQEIEYRVELLQNAEITIGTGAGFRPTK